MISIYTKLKMRDFLKGVFLGTLGIQRKLYKLLNNQNKLYKGKAYCGGYFYQGFEDIGITGAKPTNFRFNQYQVDDIIKNQDILDIGSNCGFVSCYCGRLAKSVYGVEFNSFLCDIAKTIADYLKLNNVNVECNDFEKFACDKSFDVILSLSNHHTIDGNLHMNFETYIKKCANLLNENGYLLFESHNVFASGNGGVGDDGDMDEKWKIIYKYFSIERYRMVHCYLKGMDIDKLFIVAKKSDKYIPLDFDLKTARKKYEWTYC